MLNILGQVQEASSALRKKWSPAPRVGIILGTGLGGVAADIDVEHAFPYESIPHFPHSTSICHAGKLLCGRLCGRYVVAMEGRFHAYEGYTHQQLTFPVRVMRALGAEVLVSPMPAAA